MRRLLLACVLGLACSDPLPVPSTADMRCAGGCVVDTDCGPHGQCVQCICLGAPPREDLTRLDMADVFTCVPECPRGTRCTANGCI